MPATKKRPPLEMEPGEGKAHEMAETPEEEKNEGPEPDDAPKAKSRKRSAKGAKSTKAPMDGCPKGYADGEMACKDCPECGGTCGGRKQKMDGLTPALLARMDLKCGKGSISQGEKCRKGAATQAQGPSLGIRAGQAAKGVGLGALEAVKWGSGYNIGKSLATGMTKGKNEKAGTATKVASVAASTLLFGGAAGLGAARRLGAFGSTDLQQHAKNEKKERKWRRSVGYKDSVYARGFSVDYDELAI